MQCFVGEEARRRRRIEETVVSVFEGWDYEEIIPPLFDYADVFAGEALAPKTYSFVGRDGNVLALRPDFTSLLAKIAAGRLRDRKAPLRLYYSGEVVRYEPVKAGRQSELHQMGLEHLGGEARAADAEVLAIAAECLERLGARGLVLALGHVGVFNGLVEGAGLDAERLEALRERVESKDPAGVRRALEGPALPAPTAAALERLTAMAGGLEILDEAARAFASCAAARPRRSDELRAVAGALRTAGLADRLAVDLGEVRGLDYYTGLVFRVFAPGLGFEVGGGGRYDTLLARFGRPLPAVGFMLGLDRVALLLERQGAAPEAAPSPAVNVHGEDLGAALAEARARRASGTRVRFGNGGARMSLTVALSKGKLLAGTEALFRRAGLPFPDGEGRRLVVEAGDLRFLFVKDMDVPTYVEYGVADCGVAGRDVLLETGADVLEPLDLGFGRCRLVVASPAGSGFAPDRSATTRVASKYARVAAAHFLGRGLAVEVVRLAGSVEIAPGPGPRGLHRGRGRDRPHARRERPRGDRDGGRVVGPPRRQPRELPRPARRGAGPRGDAAEGRRDEDRRPTAGPAWRRWLAGAAAVERAPAGGRCARRRGSSARCGAGATTRSCASPRASTA